MTIEEIEAVVRNLPEEEKLRLVQRLEDVLWEAWERRIELESKAGLLNPALAKEEVRGGNAERVWEKEIHDRIAAIDQGKVVGVCYEEVMQEAEKRLRK